MDKSLGGYLLIQRLRSRQCDKHYSFHIAAILYGFTPSIPIVAIDRTKVMNNVWYIKKEAKSPSLPSAIDIALPHRYRPIRSYVFRLVKSIPNNNKSTFIRMWMQMTVCAQKNRAAVQLIQ